MTTSMKEAPSQASMTWWFTGLPGAGKTTIAQAWADALRQSRRKVVVLDGDVALVSPTLHGRASARTIIRCGRFIEVYVATPLSVCQARDPKGLYQRAAKNEQFGLTGVQSEYEAPLEPQLVLDTSQLSVADALQQLQHHLI